MTFLKTTNVMIVIIVISYFVLSIITSFFLSADVVLENLAFSGENLLEGRIWTIITSIFMHGDLVHLLMNSIALFFFGRAVEEEVSLGMYLSIFFVGGVMGNLFGLFYYPYDQLMLGASGAVYAVMGAGMLLAPFKIVISPFLLPLPLAFVGLVITLTEAVALIAPASANGVSIAHIAHMGGLLTGLLFGLREGDSRKGLMILLVMFLILILTPNFIPLMSRLSLSAVIEYFVGLF